MKNVKVLSLIIAVLLVAAFAFGCSPKLDEEAAKVATQYYSDIIMKQDVVSANSYCAYDRVALTTALYTKWAADNKMTLEEYVQDLASKRDLTSISTVEEILKLQSERYAKKNIEKYGAEYFDQTPTVESFVKAKKDDVAKVVDSMSSRYAKEGIDFAQYFDADTVDKAVVVSVSADGNNTDVTDVMLVKVGDAWLYLS